MKLITWRGLKDLVAYGRMYRKINRISKLNNRMESK